MKKRGRGDILRKEVVATCLGGEKTILLISFPFSWKSFLLNTPYNEGGGREDNDPLIYIPRI